MALIIPARQDCKKLRSVSWCVQEHEQSDCSAVHVDRNVQMTSMKPHNTIVDCCRHAFWKAFMLHLTLLYLPESVIQPNLWLMVNPCLACPIKYPARDKKPSLPKLTIDRSVSAVPGQNLHLLPLSDETCLDESLHDASLSSEYQVSP